MDLERLPGAVILVRSRTVVSGVFNLEAARCERISRPGESQLVFTPRSTPSPAFTDFAGINWARRCESVPTSLAIIL